MIQILITPDGSVRINVDKEADIEKLHITGHIEDIQEAKPVEPVKTKVKRHRVSGRKRQTFLTPTQKHQLVCEYNAGGLSYKKVAERYGVCVATAIKLVKEARDNINKEEE